MMIATTLSDTAQMLELAPPERDVCYTGVCTDTRSLTRGSLFVALRGPNFDGHDYLQQASASGAAAALVSRPCRELPVLQVTDTRQALGQLAVAWRARFDLPLIAVTGSNGKTTVKEMLAAICRECGPTLATRGNLNNDLGVPLTLLGLDAGHRSAVVEMGANAPGEIDYLTRIAQPGIGVITNAAAAHLEGFGSLEGVVRAKGELYAGLPADGIAVINNDEAGTSLWKALADTRRSLTFGCASDSDIRLNEASLNLAWGDEGFECRMEITTPDGVIEVAVPLAGRHNALNALAATAAAYAAQISPAQIVAGLAKVQPVAGRLQRRAGQEGIRLIDDTYNANPRSLKAAVEVLRSCPGERWLVLGDMAELGDDAAELHRAVGEDASAAGIDRLFTVGPLSRHAAQVFGGGALHSQHHQALISSLRNALHPEVTVLVKGSRSMRMEQVVEALAIDGDRDVQNDNPERGH